jgi:hypothetical protein
MTRKILLPVKLHGDFTLTGTKITGGIEKFSKLLMANKDYLL